MAERLQQGDVLAFFPGRHHQRGQGAASVPRNLLQAAISVDAPVQPVALQFLDAQGRLSQAPCYTGDYSLIESLSAHGALPKAWSARVTFG